MWAKHFTVICRVNFINAFKYVEDLLFAINRQQKNLILKVSNYSLITYNNLAKTICLKKMSFAKFETNWRAPAVFLIFSQ